MVKRSLSIGFCFAKVAGFWLGRYFQVYTDHSALLYIQSCCLSSPRISRWALTLQEYDFTVNFVKGSENVVTDFMSRSPRTCLSTPSEQRYVLFQLCRLCTPLGAKLSQMFRVQREDEYFWVR